VIEADFETAYAKINLCLHVRARRDDGYHDLESVVAFLDYGDAIYVSPASQDSLTVDGEFANNIGSVSDNILSQTMVWVREWGEIPTPPIAIELSKHLPVAAGLGGGSADAAALLRILNRQGYIFSINDFHSSTAVLGADVPACLYSSPLIMSGIGEKIEYHRSDGSLDGIYAVLVNPGLPVSTGPVFKSWDGIDRGGLEGSTLLEMAMNGRNDLQAPAIEICPMIGHVLDVLTQTQPLITRMSGSGATCFALYDDPEKAGVVAEQIARQNPFWWVKAGNLTP
jgi:4-diphosphocytidyl-2-C-methyl-D-erythritol kinase